MSHEQLRKRSQLVKLFRAPVVAVRRAVNSTVHRFNGKSTIRQAPGFDFSSRRTGHFIISSAAHHTQPEEGKAEETKEIEVVFDVTPSQSVDALALDNPAAYYIPGRYTTRPKPPLLPLPTFGDATASDQDRESSPCYEHESHQFGAPTLTLRNSSDDVFVRHPDDGNFTGAGVLLNGGTAKTFGVKPTAAPLPGTAILPYSIPYQPSLSTLNTFASESTGSLFSTLNHSLDIAHPGDYYADDNEVDELEEDVELSIVSGSVTRVMDDAFNVDTHPQLSFDIPPPSGVHPSIVNLPLALAPVITIDSSSEEDDESNDEGDGPESEDEPNVEFRPDLIQRETHADELESEGSVKAAISSKYAAHDHNDQVERSCRASSPLFGSTESDLFGHDDDKLHSNTVPSPPFDKRNVASVLHPLNTSPDIPPQHTGTLRYPPGLPIPTALKIFSGSGASPVTRSSYKRSRVELTGYNEVIDERPDVKRPKLLNHRKMTLRDFTVLKKLGKGAFGVVYLVRHKRTGRHYAAKALPRSKIITDQRRVDTLTEQSILRRNRYISPHLSRLHASFFDKRHLYLITDYYKDKDLWKYADHPLPPHELRNIAEQLVQGLGDMHEAGVVHRDIKMDNVMLFKPKPNDDHQIAIIDYGLAENGRTPGKMSRYCGTPGYAAPEVILGMDYTSVVDVWSAGAVIFELHTGDPLFPAPTKVPAGWPINDDRYDTYIASGFIPGLEKIKDPHLKKLLEAMLSAYPGRRPSFSDLKQYKYFASTDWNLVRAKAEEALHSLPTTTIPKHTKTKDLKLSSDSEQDEDTVMYSDDVFASFYFDGMDIDSDPADGADSADTGDGDDEMDEDEDDGMDSD